MKRGATSFRVLTALQRDLKTPARVLICYDSEEDDTLPVIRDRWSGALPVELVRNQGRGAHDAVMTGLRFGKTPYVLVFPADDDYNSHMLDALVAKAENGHDIVCASRFMSGGSSVGCPPLKNVLVRTAAVSLHRIAGVPTHDATNGFRLFSRRVIDTIPVDIDPRLHLQPRMAGQGASPRLAHRRGAGAMVRAAARAKSVQGLALDPRLFTLVFLCLRDGLWSEAGKQRPRCPGLLRHPRI